MTINLAMSNTLKGAADEIVNKIKAYGETRTIILVPDRFTLSMERSILDALNVSGTFAIEVMSFTRLATKLLKGRIKKCLTPESSVLLLRKVIEESKEELEAYKSVASLTGFATNAYAAITAIRNNDISVAKFKEALPHLPKYIASKTKDLIKLYSRYLEKLSEDFSDSTTRIEALAKYIGENSEIAETNIYLLEYFSFTKKQLRVIEELMKYARNVSIGLVMDDAYDNARLYPHRTFKNIREICYRIGKKLDISYSPQKLPLPLMQIERNLYSYMPPMKISSEGMVEIYESVDIREEVANIARIIAKSVRDGKRYKDLAIVVGNPASYLSTFIRVFKLYGIPFFADIRENMLTTPPIKLVLAMLRAEFEGGRLQDILEIAKSPFMNLEASDVAIFENFCLRYAISFNVVKEPFIYGKERNDYSVAEKIRSHLAKIISIGNKGKKDIKEYISRVRQLVITLNLDNNIESFILKQINNGDADKASIMGQVLERLNALLDDMDNLLCGSVVDYDEFYALLSSMLSASEIAIVPLYFDSVYIGSAKESRYMGVSTIFIAGASEGSLPSNSRDEGILSERELRAFGELNIEVEPNATARNLEEKLHIEQLLLKPKDKLIISYTNSADSQPSSIINEMLRIFDDVKVMRTQKLYSYEPALTKEERVARASYYMPTIDSAAYELAGGLGIDSTTNEGLYAAAHLIEERRPQVFDLITSINNDEPVQYIEKGLFFQNNTTKVSELENYYTCPYKHYAQYGLDLKSREKDIEASDTGTFLHSIAELFVKRVKDYTITDEELKAITEEIFNEVLSDDKMIRLKQDKYKQLRLRLKNESIEITRGLLANQRKSAFKPEFIELNFGFGDTPPIILNANGRQLLIRGKIDRADVYENYIAIIDYKTGKVDEKLYNIYYGSKIQLYIYLKALLALGYEPAGAFYYPITSNYLTDTKPLTLKGQLLDSQEVLRAFDADYKAEPNYCSSYIPIKYNKDGKPNADTLRALLNIEEIKGLCDYAMLVASYAAADIDRGLIRKLPKADACKYCNYIDLCGGDREAERTFNTKIDKEIILEAVRDGLDR